MSLGRYGADEGSRKVSLEITVDKWISDALDKIRTKRSVSSMVNGLLAIVIRQFDPGPSSPLVYALDKVLTEYGQRAEACGDPEMVASAAFLRSRLEPYFDLAEVASYQQSKPHRFRIENTRRKDEGGGNHTTIIDSRHGGFLTGKDYTQKDYDWYAVPTSCHGTSMTYLRALNAWRCSVCGSLCRDGRRRGQQVLGSFTCSHTNGSLDITSGHERGTFHSCRANIGESSARLKRKAYNSEVDESSYQHG